MFVQTNDLSILQKEKMTFILFLLTNVKVYLYIWERLFIDW